MIKLIVFDWNGVLIADARACWEADNIVLKKFNGIPVKFNTWKKDVVIPAIDFYVKHGANKRKLLSKKEGCSNIFHTFYERRISKIRTRKNVKKILKWLHKKNIKCVILSNHTTDGINMQIKRLQIYKFIFHVIANSAKDSSIIKRNKMEKLRKFIAGEKYKPNEVLIIGDSPEEVEIGKKLGLKTIAITGGYYATFRLKKNKS